MDLWIRSQDKRYLIAINDTISIFSNSIFYQGIILGTYKTQERAIKVLDEISKKINDKYIVTAAPVISNYDKYCIRKELESFGKDAIVTDSSCTIEPINGNVVYYEMPKK